MKISLMVFLWVASCVSSFGQEVVAVFPSDTHQFKFGLSPDLAGNGEFPSGPAGFTFYDNQFYIGDRVNSRIVTLTKELQEVAVESMSDSGLALLWADRNLLIQAWNPNGPDKFLHTTLQSIEGKDRITVVMEQDQFLDDFDNYWYLTYLAGTAYFQAKNGSYFGVRMRPRTKKGTAEIVSEGTLRKDFAALKQSRFRWEGSLFLDRDQLISPSRNSFVPFFKTLPSFDSATAGPFSSATLIPLPNGSYLSQYGGALRLFDKSGKKTSETILENSVSQVAYTPDGYIYFLNLDYEKNQTEIHRLGPYPEMKFGYLSSAGVVNDNNVNLREAPSTRSSVLTKLKKGSEVGIIAQTNTKETIAGATSVWYNVRLWDRSEGWVFGSFLDLIN